MRSFRRLPQLTVDLGHDAGLRVVEELGVDLLPTAEIVYREQVGRLGEVELAEHLLVHRTIAHLAEDALALGRMQEVEKRVGLVRVLAVAGHGYGVLYENGLVGDAVLKAIVLPLRQYGLVLVTDEDVALATREGLQRVPGAARHYGDVGEEILQIGLRLGGGLALLQLGPVSGHDVPLGATGGEGVRGYYLYPRLGQVVPVLDALRIALPDNEGDDRVGDHALVLVLVPIAVNKLVVHQPRHVGL